MKIQKHSRRMRATKKGFTVVELLVVVAIMIVLAALAFIGLRKVMAYGDRTTSMNNLRQLQMANQTYASENNGTYVQAWSFDEEGNQNPAKWNVNQEFLSYFRGEVSEDASTSARNGVPVSVLDPVVVKKKSARWNRLEKSYGMNITTLEGGSNNKPGSVRKIGTMKLKTPGLTCAFMTGQNPFLTHSGRFAYNGTEENTGNTTTAYRHDGNAIAVFFDGHIEMKSMEDIRAFDKKGGAKHPFWKGF